MTCTHRINRSHWPRGLQSWPQLWVCTFCAEVFEWTEESRYWGSIECTKCSRAAIETVACSEPCARAMLERHEPKRRGAAK